MTLLIVIIYAAFISLGLPDSLLGSSWPIMGAEMGMPVSAAGIVSMVISGGTIISSFMSEKVIRRFGTAAVVTLSVGMTAVAILGFVFAPGFIWLCFLAIPLGLGAGAIDAALNNFIAVHYAAKHMSWLHCFWGVGATLSPLIMSAALTSNGGWRNGYLSVGIIQSTLLAVMIFSVSLWEKTGEPRASQSYVDVSEKGGTLHVFRIRGVVFALATFLCYCAVETSVGLWGSSFLVGIKGLNAESAAKCVSAFYIGITAGRALTGFLTLKFSCKALIRTGQIVMIGGALLLFLPSGVVPVALALIGFGCAPVYPCMIHETPARFGVEKSQTVMGMQMGFAYIGSTFMPSIFGFFATCVGIGTLPVYLLIFGVGMFAAAELLNRKVRT